MGVFTVYDQNKNRASASAACLCRLAIYPDEYGHRDYINFRLSVRGLVVVDLVGWFQDTLVILAIHIPFSIIFRDCRVSDTSLPKNTFLYIP